MRRLVTQKWRQCHRRLYLGLRGQSSGGSAYWEYGHDGGAVIMGSYAAWLANKQYTIAGSLQRVTTTEMRISHDKAVVQHSMGATHNSARSIVSFPSLLMNLDGNGPTLFSCFRNQIVYVGGQILWQVGTSSEVGGRDPAALTGPA